MLAHIASRLPDMDDVATFLSFAVDGVVVEKALHEQFNPDKSIAMSEVCMFYTSFLRAQSQTDVAVEAAAVLPCFWVYQHVGKYIHAIAQALMVIPTVHGSRPTPTPLSTKAPPVPSPSATASRQRQPPPSAVK